MSDVVVRFTADLSYRCTGDIVRLSAVEQKAVDKEAEFLGVEQPYEVIEEPTQDEKVESDAEEVKPETKAKSKKS